MNAVRNNVELVIKATDPNIYCELHPENDHRNIFCSQDFSHSTTNFYTISKEQQNRQTAIASIINHQRWMLCSKDLWCAFVNIMSEDYEWSMINWEINSATNQRKPMLTFEYENYRRMDHQCDEWEHIWFY